MAAADPRPEELTPGVYCLQTGRGLTEANVYLVRSGPAGRCWVVGCAAGYRFAPRPPRWISGAGFAGPRRHLTTCGVGCTSTYYPPVLRA
jgi:hypothetical protein